MKILTQEEGVKILTDKADLYRKLAHRANSEHLYYTLNLCLKKAAVCEILAEQKGRGALFPRPTLYR